MPNTTDESGMDTGMDMNPDVDTAAPDMASSRMLAALLRWTWYVLAFTVGSVLALALAPRAPAEDRWQQRPVAAALGTLTVTVALAPDEMASRGVILSGSYSVDTLSLTGQYADTVRGDLADLAGDGELAERLQGVALELRDTAAGRLHLEADMRMLRKSGR